MVSEWEFAVLRWPICGRSALSFPGYGSYGSVDSAKCKRPIGYGEQFKRNVELNSGQDSVTSAAAFNGLPDRGAPKLPLPANFDGRSTCDTYPIPTMVPEYRIGPQLFVYQHFRKA